MHDNTIKTIGEYRIDMIQNSIYGDTYVVVHTQTENIVYVAPDIESAEDYISNGGEETHMRKEVNISKLLREFADMAGKNILLVGKNVEQDDILNQIVGTIIKVSRQSDRITSTTRVKTPTVSLVLPDILLSPYELYQKIGCDSIKGCTEIYVYHITKFLDRYIYNPVALIIKMIDKIIESVDEIDDYYHTLSDDEYMEVVDYPDNIRKIQKDFCEYGFTISPLQAEAIWYERSDTCAAQWLGISDDDNTFCQWFVHCVVGLI